MSTKTLAKIGAVAASIVFYLSLMSWTAYAQGGAVCSDRDKIRNHLGDRYAEYVIAVGLSNNGKMLEVYSSESGSWTIVVVDPYGEACVVASGEAWAVQRPPVLEEDKPHT